MTLGPLLRALACGLLILRVDALVLAQDTTPRSFSFAVIGDTPYYPHEEVYLRSLLKSLAREPIEFVVHVGDIKSGSSRCDDGLYASRRALFDASPRPFVLYRVTSSGVHRDPPTSVSCLM